jgi:hypothetical protein
MKKIFLHLKKITMLSFIFLLTYLFVNTDNTSADTPAQPGPVDSANAGCGCGDGGGC